MERGSIRFQTGGCPAARTDTTDMGAKMQRFEMALAILCYGFAFAMMAGFLFLPPEFYRFGWFFAFPAWWLVGVFMHARARR